MERVRILAIDPGPDVSSLVTLYDNDDIDVERDMPNHSVVIRIGYEAAMIESIPELKGSFIAIEDMTPYGSPLSYGTISTLKWIGKFEMAAGPKCRVELITRIAVKQNLLGVARGDDAMVRDALIHRFGGQVAAIGKKRTPGPLYPVKSHAWAALAVAVVARTWRSQNVAAATVSSDAQRIGA